MRIDPKPNIRTLFDVCAGYYESYDPAFASRCFEGFCTCIAARNGNVDRLRRLREVTAQQQPTTIDREWVRMHDAAWVQVVIGLPGDPIANAQRISAAWSYRSRFLRLLKDWYCTVGKLPPAGFGAAAVYRAAIESESALQRLLEARIDAIDSALFTALVGLEWEGASAVALVLSESMLERSGFPDERERRDWFLRHLSP